MCESAFTDLLGPLQKYLAGSRFATDADVKQAASSWLQTLYTDFIYAEIQTLTLQWEKCLNIIIVINVIICVLLLFVSSYVLIVCTVPLPRGVNPIAVDKYINININIDGDHVEVWCVPSATHLFRIRRRQSEVLDISVCCIIL